MILKNIKLLKKLLFKIISIDSTFFQLQLD
jgi:hypothetical protein